MCRQDVSGDKLFNAAAFEPEEEEEEEDDVDIDLKPTIDLAGAAQYLTGVAKKDVKEEVHARVSTLSDMQLKAVADTPILPHSPNTMERSRSCPKRKENYPSSRMRSWRKMS